MHIKVGFSFKTMEKDNLMKSIEESDEFFCRMVDLIPPEHFGFDEEIKSKLKTEKHETTDRKLKNGISLFPCISINVLSI